MTQSSSPLWNSLTSGWIVPPDWLADRLDDPRITIVDCRFSLMQPDQGREQYHISHIPGAFYLDLNQDLSSPVEQHGGRHPLPDPAVLAEKLTAIGVQSAAAGQEPTLVVAYDDSRFGFAARLWWLLRYLGHDQVVVLNGGLKAWQEKGYPVSSEVPTARTGNFVPQIRSDWVVSMETVRASKDNSGVVLVDSREAERYRGEREPIDPIAGHIPGAVNYPWQEVTDASGFVQSPIVQQQRWSDIQDAPEIWVYCGSGVTACVNLLSLAIANLPQGKLYAGSWSDWCSHYPNVPIAP
ncbi:sulfurtransferase [Leptolyngbya ohadii]|uniref:sulfurtransferase n=1 Tax=Leptolyngbya ohadii TaxID=1962290 RepID=UPI000B59967C|nr:sulfurtransferase [Leptolyngbya ohadii]